MKFRFAIALLTLSFAATAEGPALMDGVRQLTFDGRRSGEGYFSADGRTLVFQSEREPDNPFYQIYALDMETGDTERISPGHGKTTCSWVHPDGARILYASTQDDPEAVAKQKSELADREAGKEKRYAWDYDPTYELYEYNRETKKYTRLTNALGYDAECAYSPDGSQIVFASNRHAYTENLSNEDKEILAYDQSLFMDIYIMDADGSNVKRLTDVRGYDGGPFFSADGKKICWRRFSEDGVTAEIFTMNTDGANQTQLTEMGAMSWAPFFHPSGEYLVFATNKHGFGNFELYMVDAEGKHEPVRVTESNGFDGLASFTPDGNSITWTSNRGPKNQSQIYIAKWDHAAALAHLEKSTRPGLTSLISDEAVALAEGAATGTDISANDIRHHVEVLASEEMEGRMTGTPGAKLAEDYVAALFQRYGLAPDGDDGTYFQTFEFTAGISLGEENTLAIQLPGGEKSTARLDEDWRPLAFSATGPVESQGVAFAGYGLVAPAGDDFDEYDSYVHLDVEGKWVMMFRFIPEDITPEQRQHLNRYASLRHKAMIARDKGAAGIIIVSGPNSQVKDPLAKLAFDVSLGGTSVVAVTVTDDIAQRMLDAADKNLGELQTKLDTGEPLMGFALDGVQVHAEIDLVKEKRTGRNVIARLGVGNPHTPAVVIGAHLDHLGRGHGSGSLAVDDEEGEIHYGADDNASGVAALLEIAERFAYEREKGNFEQRRDIYFAAWSGEELGLLGSDHFVKEVADMMGTPNDISFLVAAYLNMDMIGRIDKALILNGAGSSDYWRGEIERRNVPIGLNLTVQDDSYLPTDATSFYLKKVPILSAFSGAHEDYHTPRDTSDKLNYEGAGKTARLFALITRSLALSTDTPEYIAMKKPESRGSGGMRAYLGTVPDYADTDITGLRLSGVTSGAPADEAGLKGGDIIVELAGKKVENIYDYTYAIEALKIGDPVTIVVLRGEERVELTITPQSRE